jgi:inner membrane protein
VTWQTHVMGGLSTLWLLQAGTAIGMSPAPSTEQIALLAGAAALGSLLPDLDASQSKIKHLSVAGIKPFYLPSQAIFRTLGHRTLLHSLRGLSGVAILGLTIAPFLGWRIALAIVAGYASHLALDASNPSGIPWLYPNPCRFHLLPKKWRIATGSPPEEIVFVLFALLALLFFLLQLQAI